MKVKKNIPTKSVVKSSKKDVMMILLEDMRGEIHAVAEGHSILARGIENLRGEFVELRGEFVELRGEFVDLRGEFVGFKEEIRNNFKLVFEHFSNIEDEIMEIKSEIKELRRELKDKSEIKKLNDLEVRVRKLELNQMVLRDESKKKYKE